MDSRELQRMGYYSGEWPHSPENIAFSGEYLVLWRSPENFAFLWRKGYYSGEWPILWRIPYSQENSGEFRFSLENFAFLWRM